MKLILPVKLILTVKLILRVRFNIPDVKFIVAGFVLCVIIFTFYCNTVKILPSHFLLL